MNLENLYKLTGTRIHAGLSGGGMCVKTVKGVDGGCSNFSFHRFLQSWKAQLHRFVKLNPEGRGVRTAPSFLRSAD